jgi:transposase
MARIVADLASDWRRLDERIETVTDEIGTLAKSDDSCRRVMTVPGIGPIAELLSDAWRNKWPCPKNEGTQ